MEITPGIYLCKFAEAGTFIFQAIDGSNATFTLTSGHYVCGCKYKVSRDSAQGIVLQIFS